MLISIFIETFINTIHVICILLFILINFLIFFHGAKKIEYVNFKKISTARSVHLCLILQMLTMKRL